MPSQNRISIDFLALTGPIKIIRSQEYANMTEALEAVRQYAEAAGFSNVKRVDGDDPYDGFRITAKTPGGRNGRNIAFGDWV